MYTISYTLSQDIEREWAGGKWWSRGHLYLQGSTSKSINVQPEISLSYLGLLLFTSLNQQQFFCSIFHLQKLLRCVQSVYILTITYPFPDFFSYLEHALGKSNKCMNYIIWLYTLFYLFIKVLLKIVKQQCRDKLRRAIWSVAYSREVE